VIRFSMLMVTFALPARAKRSVFLKSVTPAWADLQSPLRPRGQCDCIPRALSFSRRNAKYFACFFWIVSNQVEIFIRVVAIQKKQAK
jgi:hypothetical protein